MTRFGKELHFISTIRRDGSGCDPINSDEVDDLKENSFKMNRLSITFQTYIASEFNSYVVKLKADVENKPTNQ